LATEPVATGPPPAGNTEPVPVSPVTAAASPSEPAPASGPFSAPAGTSDSEAVAQLVPESATVLKDPEPTSTADAIAATVARLVDDLIETSSEGVADIVEEAGDVARSLVQAAQEALGALVAVGADGVPEPVKELLKDAAGLVADLAHALGAVLGGDGDSYPADNSLERVADLANNLAHALDEALGEALGALVAVRADGVPEPVKELLKDAAGLATDLTDGIGTLLGGSEASDSAGNPVTRPLGFFYPYFERVVEVLSARSFDALGDLAQSAGEAGLGAAPHGSGDKQGAPPIAPTPAVPGAPGGTAPASYSASLGAAGSSADAFQLLFAVLVAFSIALLKGGKLWYHREPLGPRWVLRSALERPG
jgi:hypothetical protein